MTDPLAHLVHEGVVDEVVGRLKSGKEADVYLVRHAGEVVAAKVYKERLARSFRNDAAYREGRQVRDTRTQRAMDRGSRFGRAAAEDAWKTKEADALHTLHAAGVRVPRPVLFFEGVLLMGLVLDAQGRPAPRLVDAEIAPDQAAALYADVRASAVKMLACDLIHGDLSPYNVLLGSDGPTIIDFPQVVGAAHNSQAERFFERDVETVRRFFAAHDPQLAASAGDAHEIWRAYVRRELRPDFVPTGRPPPAPRRPPAPVERPGRGGEPRHAPARPAHGARPPHGPERASHPSHRPERPSHQPERPSHAPPRPAHARPAGHAPGRPPQQGGRPPPAHVPRAASGPEVVRVRRSSPPVAPAPPAAAHTGHAAHPATGAAPNAPPGPPAAGKRRRRRRRRGPPPA